MTPEMAMGELRQAMEVALLVLAPMLITVLVLGVVVGILQAATQINEPTIAFVVKLIGLAAVLLLMGGWILITLVDFTVRLFQQIPQLVS